MQQIYGGVKKKGLKLTAQSYPPGTAGGQPVDKEKKKNNMMKSAFPSVIRGTVTFNNTVVKVLSLTKVTLLSLKLNHFSSSQMVVL